ncbi:hypothetical protein FJ987_29650 [Mesorhizobium sp. CU2]|uniref:hypothetical protein n=1 Tax=unclassified Mesorhizobium TaxID=325217 RepID=UPI001128F7C7|nr:MULTISPECIES: hypothetical protein [unclassified Mesorhizobium]TPN80992.1 hypothetical protein FJ988_18975 [Mesorhizobium sp. CU3]TPO01776.1 hypothetical protein FJ987_29650 [Mesorhizobium sp. CU2]
MKPEKKPFVVEIKNRRRLARREHSISGEINLKAAGDQVAAEQTGDENGAAMALRPSDAVTAENTRDINA